MNTDFNTNARMIVNPIDNNRLRSESIKILNLGLACNVVLALSKTIVGIFGHSRALLADGINSISDVVYYLVVKVFMKLAHKPADECHPYGHRKMESIAALVIGTFIITTAMALFWDSASDAFHFFTNKDKRPTPSLLSLTIAIVTILTKIHLYFYTKRGASRFGNFALMALAYDHRNDIFSAMAVVLGIIFSIMGYAWVDPLAGTAVSALILKTGIKIIKDSSNELMDGVPGKLLNDAIRETITDIEGIKSIEEIKTHRIGPQLIANISIGVDGEISVTEGDKIATQLEDKLITSIKGLTMVYVHFHPEKK